MAKSTKKKQPDRPKNGKQVTPASKQPTVALKKKAAPKGLLVPASSELKGRPLLLSGGPADPNVLDRLWAVVQSRRNADPNVSHSARLLARGTAKVAQKFGEESVECLIEAVAGNRAALIAESADVLYHLLVLWVDGGVRPEEVWSELTRREGVSGLAEKASRAGKVTLALGVNTRKIP